MHLIIFTGIPGSGKSSFYKEYFFNSHMRVNLDMLKTRNREKLLLSLCFTTSMPVVIDNTNVKREERAVYIALGKQYGYKITGYNFQSDLKECIARNSKRTGKAKIAEAGIIAKYRQLELPQLTEGYDELFYVTLKEDNTFEISEA
jgi:predicted kinase